MHPDDCECLSCTLEQHPPGPYRAPEVSAHRALLREAADALDAAMAHTCGLAGRERCALCQLLRRLREAAK